MNFFESRKCRCLEAKWNPEKPYWKIGLQILGTEFSVPLQSISYLTTIVNGIAKTELNQVYYNPFDKYLEVEYLMPISERVCFTDFKAIYEGKEISGIIKEKEKAKQEYTFHKEKGDVVAYSEINEKAMDIMKISLGNIEPNKNITIKLSYLEDLDVSSSNKFWKHIVYSIVRPRYSSLNEKSESAKDIGPVPVVSLRDCDHPPYTWNITTKISHSSKIDFIKSTSHEISVETTDEFTVVKLDPQNKNNAPTRDFVLLFRDENINKPQAVLGRSITDSGTHYSANITFVPNFSNLSADDAFKAQLSSSTAEEFEIDFIKSTSHEISVETTNEFTVVKLDPQNKNNAPTRDFILLFRDENINKPQAVLGRSITDSGTRYSANITFVPNFSNLSADDAFKAQLSSSNAEEFDIDFDSARGEYIFFLDRSCSMRSRRIDTAKNALILFLKSLPVESFYNVYSFGTSYELLHGSSQQINDIQLTKDIEIIKLFSANLGGTEILSPFEALAEIPSKKGYPRQIFLLTDGDVSNTDSVLEAIAKESKFSRIHTIGVGSGASPKLIKEGAKRGKGSSLMLADNEDVTGKIIDLLQKSLTPCLDKFEFVFDKNLIDIVAPNPENISAILKNEPFNMTMFFKPITVYPFKTEVQLKCFDSFAKTTLDYVIRIDSEDCKFHESVFKYGCHRYINDLLFSSKSKRDFSKDIFIARKIDLESEVVELSIKEQILCEKTAFICVIKEASDSMKIEKQNKGDMKFIVPSIVPADDPFQLEKESMLAQKFKWQMSSPPSSSLKDLNYLNSNFKSEVETLFSQRDLMMKTSLKSDRVAFTLNKNKKSSESFFSRAKNAIGSFFVSKSENKKKKQERAASSTLVAENFKPHNFTIEEESTQKKCATLSYFKADENAKCFEKREMLENHCISQKKLSECNSIESDLVQKRDYLSVITLQKPNGLWEGEEKLYKLLSSEKSVLEALISVEMKEKLKNETDLLNYFLTIFVLAWLNTYFEDKKSSWKLIEKKSRQLLDKKLKNELSFDWEALYKRLLNNI